MFAFYRILAVGVASALVLSGCCEKPKVPCLPWIEDGQTYTIELVQHFETRFAGNPNVHPPYDGYRSAQRTCGMVLDLQIENAFQMTAASRVMPDHSCWGCYFVEARADVPGVQVIGDFEGIRSIGGPYFLAQSRVRIGEGCEGMYTIGIAPLSAEFKAQRREWVATDHMLFRYFSTSDPEPCLSEGSRLAEHRNCWDSWAVRIRDASGNLLTQDNPDPPPPAPIVDAGADASDGATPPPSAVDAGSEAHADGG